VELMAVALDPLGEPVSHGFRPPGGLGAIRRQELLAAYQVSDQAADVIGQVQVL
jgi:hypothetical protein